MRDAIAVDLVKLDDDSVSNDSIYTAEEHIEWSPMEYERYLLHKNFRIHLVNLEPEWSNLNYEQSTAPTEKRTWERMYQGMKISEELARYFYNVFASSESEYVYVPTTNANDFYSEVALVPNTHPDFKPISTRAFYDKEWMKYK